MFIELALAAGLSREVTPMEKGYALEFSTRRTHSSALIRSAGPAALEVTVTLPGEGPAPRLTLTWQGVPLDPEELRKRVVELEGVSGAEDHVFDLKQNGAVVAALTWSSRGETPGLKALRELLEGASHLALVETTAYLKRGESQAAEGAHEAAYRSFQTGVEILGGLYHDRATVDDSGTRVALSRWRFKEGDVERAATILQGVLEGRVASYRRVHLGQAR